MAMKLGEQAFFYHSNEGREIVGIVEVFSTQPFAFDEGDIAVVQRIAQTVLLAMSQAAELDIC